MNTNDRTVGIALGGGGVRGLGHVPALEAIDACGITPKVIAGTSMGAIMGALYASGKTGREIRSLIEQHIVTRDDRLKNVYAKKGFLLKWFDAVRLSWKGSGIFRIDGFLRYLIEQMDVSTFEELKIPLRVVATDFDSGEALILDAGPLLPALNASIAIPGVFEPVQLNGKVLFDGGIANNLPYDIIAAQCDLTIAVDVSPTRTKGDGDPPGMIDATVGMFDVLMARATKAKLEQKPPDIYFHPRIVGVRMLEFQKADDVFAQTAECIGEFTDRLEQKI